MNGMYVALTISSDGVKFGEISQQNGKAVVRGLRHIAVPRDDDASFAELGKQAIGGDIPGSRKAVLIINSEDVIYRDFSFPFSSAKKVSGAIRFEISAEYPPDEFTVDHIEILSGEPGRKAFLAAIIRKEVLRKRIQATEALGLQVMDITCDLSCLGNYFAEDTEALVMDMGERHTLFALFSHRIPLLARGLSIGFRDILGREGEVNRESLRSLGSEIKRTIHSFNARTGLDLDKVHLSGGLLSQPSIIRTLKDGGDFQFIDAPPTAGEYGVQEDDTGLNLYASLLGTVGRKKGTRSFDFYKEEFVGTNTDALVRTSFRWGTLLLISFLLAWFLSSWFKITALQKRDAFLSAEIRRVFTTSFPQVSKVVDEVKQARSLLAIRKAELGGANPFSSASILDVMELISLAIPKEINFQVVNLFWERGRVEIDGRTDSFKTVNSIQELLSKSQGFSDVTISNAKSRSDGQDVEFKITIRVAG